MHNGLKKLKKFADLMDKDFDIVVQRELFIRIDLVTKTPSNECWRIQQIGKHSFSEEERTNH